MADPPASRRPAALPAVALDPPPPGVRLFERQRPVRFGDADRRGQVRLDALAAYLQDVAGDDTDDVGLRDIGGWVVRRTVFEVVRAPTYAQTLTLTTWASGAGPRWAERRFSVTAPGEARVESVSLWVHVDRTTLRPAPLDAGFAAVYAPATRGRAVSSRLSHPPSADPALPLERMPWAIRAADIDPYGHVNNAATWAIVEEALAARPQPAPYRAELEYRTPIEPGTAVAIDVQAAGPGQAGVALWVRNAASGALFATARVLPLAG